MDAVRYRLAMPISSVIEKGIREDYKNRLIKLCNKTSLEVLLSLKNGSVGAKANLFRLAYPEIFEHDLIIDGPTISIKGSKIGTLNIETSLSIKSCETSSEGNIHIQGNLLLPSFISKPEIHLSTDKGETILSNVNLDKSADGNYMAIDDTPFYQRYNLSVDISDEDINIANGQPLYFYLNTDTDPVKLYANRSQNVSSCIKDGKVLI